MISPVRREPDTCTAPPAPQSFIDVDHMSPELNDALREAGISPAQLRSIAGSDSVLRGDVQNLYDRIGGLDRAGASVARGRSSELGRSMRLYDAIRAEVARNAEAPAAIERRQVAGLRSAMGNDRILDRAPAGARPPDAATTYRSAERPPLPNDREAPERKCWFIRFLETIFCWLPGVHTDNDRLRAYGRRMADEHGSDIQAYRQAYAAEVAARPRARWELTAPDSNGESRQAMIDHVAARMIADARRRGGSMDRGVAEERATVVVDALLARMEENRQADRARVAELHLANPGAREAPDLAESAIPALETARRLGPPWTTRMQQALGAVPDTHPFVAVNEPDKRDRARLVVNLENTQTVQYLMAMQQGGHLANVPASAIDGLLAAERAGKIDHAAVADTVSELERMPDGERRALLASIESVPADRREYAYAILAREHIGLSSSNAQERQGSLQRVKNAADELKTMTADQAASAFRRGTLGLGSPVLVNLELPAGPGKTERVSIPVYLHPALTPAERERYLGMVREAYGHVPPAMMRRLIAAEGGEAFSVQISKRASVHADLYSQERPGSNRTAEGGRYEPETNGIRLNGTELDAAIAAQPNGEGRSRAITMILHETAHMMDDLADPDQNRGYFVTRGAGAQDRMRARISGQGELAPAWAHFMRTRDRYQELRHDMDDPDARAAYMLSGRNPRTPAEEKALIRASDRLAARSGAVSEYGGAGGDENPARNPGLMLGEWWAEVHSRYLNPATREHLRAVDPVAYEAVKQSTALIERGVAPKEAMEQSLRWSLSTAVSAQQGQELLRTTPQGTALSGESLGKLEGIAQAFDTHARALDGWRAYDNDAGLRTLRRGEAEAGIREGRALQAQLAARRRDLEQRGQQNTDEYRRLTAIETNLTRSIAQLESRLPAR